MAIEKIANMSTETLAQLIIQIGKIGLWVQAIGVLIILWLTFQIISFISLLKRKKKLEAIEERLVSIEKKLDMILKKRNPKY